MDAAVASTVRHARSVVEIESQHLGLNPCYFLLDILLGHCNPLDLVACLHSGIALVFLARVGNPVVSHGFIRARDGVLSCCARRGLTLVTPGKGAVAGHIDGVWAMMRNGLYALGALIGTPPAPEDAAILFGPHGAEASIDECALLGFERATPVESVGSPFGLRLFLGAIDSADDQDQTVIDRIAASVARVGVDAVREPGEWLYADWDQRARTLTLLASECMLNPCYVATDGRHVAVAPDLPRLAKLDWIDDSLNADVLIRAMRPAGQSREFRQQTILRQVTRLLPGEKMVVSALGVVRETAEAEPPPPLRRLAFQEAMGELDALLRGIMRRALDHGGDTALLLSGGLDSSLIAALAVEQRQPGQRLVCLTSVAPPGSGIEDETEWAASVADHLRLPLVCVAPDPATDIYRLRPERLFGAGGPLLAPSHFLYDALEDQAVALGAEHIIDGVFGELTISSHDLPRGNIGLRSMLAGLRARFRNFRAGADTFIVRPSVDVLAYRFSSDHPWRPRNLGSGAFGFAPGFDKAAYRTTEAVHPQLPYSFPFRDRALGRTMAALPARYVMHGGMDRAPIRALLAGRVPDRIVRRQTKLPFSPAYYTLLVAHAGSARERIAAQRSAGADQWLDLDWLDRQLASVTTGATLSPATWSQVHATALFAEFIRWWRTDRTTG